MVGWNFSTRLPDFHKDTLDTGWRSKLLYFLRKILENSYSTILLMSLPGLSVMRGVIEISNYNKDWYISFPSLRLFLLRHVLISTLLKTLREPSADPCSLLSCSSLLSNTLVLWILAVLSSLVSLLHLNSRSPPGSSRETPLHRSLEAPQGSQLG